MLISRRYRREQQRLHDRGGYGIRGDKHAHAVARVAHDVGAAGILDYGCGAGALARFLAECGIEIAEYDPAVDGKRALPQPADLVVCVDVLEHVEPDCLDAIVLELRRLTLVALFAVIATRPAGKTLSNGRNAHLTVEGPAWWRHKLEGRFRIKAAQALADEWAVLLKPRMTT